MTDETTTTNEQTGELIHLDPATLTIATNVRTDLAEDKEFAASIKARGVLEPVTVYRAEDGTYAVLRGQRRTVTATKVGTPTGTIPCRVVAKPEEADRIGDQMVENLHRAAMRDREVLAGVEQLALLGVSAAQITKRVALPRASVNAAIAVAGKKETRERVEAGDLTLDQAAIYAEFEDDAYAIERLDQERRYGRSLEHVAQRLRDQAAERAAYAAEVERLQAEGLPAMSAEEVEEARRNGGLHRIERLVDAEGQPVPAEEYANVPGARVQVVTEWVYPESAEDEEAEDEAVESGEAYEALTPVWVVTDLETAGLRTRYGSSGPGARSRAAEESEEAAEARRAERRRVIANNKAWASAETVRREWLRTFVARKTPPKGAEALICDAVILGRHDLCRALEIGHPMLRDLLGSGSSGPSRGSADITKIAARATSPKAATMTTLAAVVTAWEASTSKQTWRTPSPWDGRVLAALIEWGYKASDVEQLLLPQPDADNADNAADTDTDDADAGDAAEAAEAPATEPDAEPEASEQAGPADESAA